MEQIDKHKEKIETERQKSFPQEDEILGELSARLTHLEIHARETQEKIES
jgi:hypothetical protein